MQQLSVAWFKYLTKKSIHKKSKQNAVDEKTMMAYFMDKVFKSARTLKLVFVYDLHSFLGDLHSNQENIQKFIRLIDGSLPAITDIGKFKI